MQSLSYIFKKSPSIDYFENVWVPEFKKEGFCTGYYWYEDECSLIYSITLNKCHSRHYLTKGDFKVTGFYQEAYRLDFKPKFHLFQIVRVRATEQLAPICGMEWTSPYGWHYHLDNGRHKPYCQEELSES